MLINDGRILKNGNNIFKSQVIDSYIETNTTQYQYIDMSFSGITETNPLFLYYRTPSGVTKYSYISDTPNYQQFIPATNESSYKQFYFSGNVEGLYALRFYGQGTYYGYYYNGDLTRLFNQFPNLQSFQMGRYPFNQGNTSKSIFNQDLSYTSFPKNLKKLDIDDSTLSGKINTIKNFESLEEITIVHSLFENNFTNINFKNLNKLYIEYLYNLRGNVNDLFTKNPNLDFLWLYECNLFSGNSSTFNTSKLKAIVLYIQQNPNITGNVTNWIFNTGLTQIQLQNQYLDGDITNWNFSNTQLTSFSLYNYIYGGYNRIYGNLSGWVLPSTINGLTFNFVSGITAAPINLGEAYYATFYECYNINQDINNFIFGSRIQSFQFYNYSRRGKLHGNIETFAMPSTMTYLSFISNSITGNVTGITFNSVLNGLDLTDNLLEGNPVHMTIPNSLYTLTLNNNNIKINFDIPFHTKNLQYIDFRAAWSGITGNFSNLIIDNTLQSFKITNSNTHCDLSELDITKIGYLDASNCISLYGNLSNWLTGTTMLYNMNISYNPHLSGSTTNWNVNAISDLRISGTELSGKLKHNAITWLLANSTKITSNIETDFNLSNTMYFDVGFCPHVTGNLKNITMNYGMWQFYVQSSTGITGSNEFINYIFVNRKNWNAPYGSLNIAMQNIGDSVTGATETLGDLGTYTQFSGSSQYYYYDLTEAQVNNLAAGHDWDSAGSNTPWDSKQKIWWTKNARVSSSNFSNRYHPIYIYY